LNLVPDFITFAELCRPGRAVPVRVELEADTETPVSAFLKLRGEGPSFLLESAEQGRLGRWSFLGFRPRAVLRWSEGTLRELGPDGRHELSARPVEDPYGAVGSELDRYEVAAVEGLPPFAGGAVGFFGYDLVRTVEPLGEPNPDPLELPDLALIVAESMVVFDHLRQEVSIIANAFCEEGELEAAYGGALEEIAQVRDRLRAPIPRPAPIRQLPEDDRGPVRFESNMSREGCEANVARIVEYIRAGDAYQVVPSQRFSAPCPVDPFSIYRGLRAVNPSPYMYFLDFEDFQIAGASPEPLLTVSGRTVSTRPIAGTRPRGATVDDDKAIAEELLADEKERAEHVMLVDLGRNDLGRVCEFGSVHVESFMGVEP
jgi:anthranilate synthase component I